MRAFKPGYYDEFSCIADKCKHSCCIGWEIDVDSDKLEVYRNAEGDFGRMLKENISVEGVPHFVLKAGDRCPFLNEDNLCDIIINLGEGALCQICRDHPRFVNFFSERKEIGLGMCCEEAARIIVGFKEKFKIEGSGKADYEEAVFFNWREQIFAIVQDREWTVDERCENLCEFCNLTLPEKAWVRIFEKLERLDGAWDTRLALLNNERRELKDDWELSFEQILVYFIYRHLSEGIYDGRYKERLMFAILSFYMIKEIFCRGEETMEELCEICRMYSSEIEYSEENVECLLKELERE